MLFLRRILYKLGVLKPMPLHEFTAEFMKKMQIVLPRGVA